MLLKGAEYFLPDSVAILITLWCVTIGMCLGMNWFAFSMNASSSCFHQSAMFAQVISN